MNIQVSGGQTENYSTENVTVYVYDSSRSKAKVSVGDAADLSVHANDGSRVFVRIYKDEVKETVIVK